MREWNLKPGGPLALNLCADARFCSTDYTDDQIWELSLAGGEPPALALQTTFGLRARALRMFPRFTLGDITKTDPVDFERQPIVRSFYPNFMTVEFSPFVDIDVTAEFWVPQSHAIAGRLTLSNISEQPQTIKIDWVGQLSPVEGQRMAPMNLQAAPILTGQTADLAPVIFLTGGSQAGSGSYPTLNLPVELPGGQSRTLTWTHAALPELEESFALARDLATRNWDAERARIELLNASQVEIHTGNSEWDIAFALAQKQAFSLLVGPTDQLPHISFVLSRQPDQGFSLRGDGSDYNHQWNGQSPLEAYYLANLLLPAAPTLVAGFLRNFLAVQDENGFIDWKPGLAGQRSHLLAVPLLASLAWRIYEFTQDEGFLAETYSPLLKFLRSWFTPDHDRDEDGLPEWDHPVQSGAEDSPLFSRWNTWSQGVEISTAETPALCAFLYREAATLKRIAQLIGNPTAFSELEAIMQRMQVAVGTAWNGREAIYQNWDRDTHAVRRMERLEEFQGSGQIQIQRSIDPPARLLIQIETDGEATRHPIIFIHGRGLSGNHRVERITADAFKWYLGTGRMTGEHIYTQVEQIDLQGLLPEDRISIYSVGHHCLDHTQLLPLWAGIPTANRAAQLVNKTITNPKRFWRAFGLPACVEPPKQAELAICRSANLLWNALIGEGLLQYGYREEAADLIRHLMTTIIETLKKDKGFRRYYQADSGEGLGERNTLAGLPPVGLFLETLGVRLISPYQIALHGFNPFPWPVTVKYRGITILSQADKVTVIFNDGQTISVTDPEPCIVALEMEPSG